MYEGATAPPMAKKTFQVAGKDATQKLPVESETRIR